MNHTSAQPPSNTKPREAPSTNGSRAAASLLSGRVSRISAPPLLEPSEEVKDASPELCKNATEVMQQEDDDIEKLRAEIDSLRKANEVFKRQLCGGEKDAEEEEEEEEEEASEQKRRERVPKKSGKAAHDHLKLLDKISRLESHLLETQRRSEETIRLLETKLDRALESNRALRAENSAGLDEMKEKVRRLEARVETEKWCSEAARIVRDDFDRSRRRDEWDLVRSRYERIVRERDMTVAELRSASRRKDDVIEMLGKELRGAKEELCRLKLAEAAKLGSSSSQSKMTDAGLENAGKQLESDETSPAANVSKRVFRRNSANAKCT